MRKTGEAPDLKKNKKEALRIIEKFQVDTSKDADGYKKQMEVFAPKKPPYTLIDVKRAI